jgi:hypothetical protein
MGTITADTVTGSRTWTRPGAGVGHRDGRGDTHAATT